MVAQCVVAGLEEGACGWGRQKRVGGHVGDLGPLEEGDPWGAHVLCLQSPLLLEGHLEGHRGALLLDLHSVEVGSCSELQTGATLVWWHT